MSKKPEPLLKHFVGKKLCEDIIMPDGKPTKLCVVGGKYGFSGWLLSRTDGSNKLPVSTGDARTTQQAMRNAKAFVEGVRTKRN